jgi:hypothetical protein
MASAKTISERVVKLEVEMCNLQDELKEQLVILNSRLEGMIDVSNHEHTKIYELIDKQQRQIDKILSQCLSHQLETEKIKITNKVLYVIGGAIAVGSVTILFDVIRRIFGL